MGPIHPVPRVRPRPCARSSTRQSIDSSNYQPCKIIKNRGHFPNDTAAIKLLWLAIRTIEDKRARERAKEAGPPKVQPARPPADSPKAAADHGWRNALVESP